MDEIDLRLTLGPVSQALFGEFTSLREVQVRAIPSLLSGQSALIVAPTASGKTEAAMAPLLHGALNSPGARPYAIWISPTRALANDLYERMVRPFDRLGLALAVRTGEHKRNLRSRPAAILTTPESLDVMLSARATAAALLPVEMVVVDETHLFYGTPRGLQLLMLLQRLENLSDRRLLRAGLSATISDPARVGQWLAGDGPPVTVVTASHAREVNMSLLGCHADARERTVMAALRNIELGREKQLIFVNARNEADFLAEELQRRLQNVPTYLHFSSLPKGHREDVEARFKSGGAGVCVATSTLELGIDIGDIDATLLYGAPGSIASFLQRVGRGNRRTATSQVTAICRTHDARGAPREDLWKRDVLAFAGIDVALGRGIIESSHVPDYWSVMVQQAFSLARYYERIGQTPLLKAAGHHIAPFADEPSLGELLEHLATLGYLDYRPHGEYYALDDKGWEWLQSLQIWSNFSSHSNPLRVLQDGELLDSIAWSNRYLLQSGALLRIKGHTREVDEVGSDYVRVRKPTHGGTPLTPARVGAAWHVSFDLAQVVASLGDTFATISEDVEPNLRSWLSTWSGRLSSLPLDEVIPVEQGSEESALTFLGGLGNRLLQESLASLGQYAAVDEWGVRTSDPDAFRDVKAAPPLATIAPKLRGDIPASVHFSLLPTRLQNLETAAIVGDPRVLERIRRLPALKPISIPPPPPTLRFERLS